MQESFAESPHARAPQHFMIVVPCGRRACIERYVSQQLLIGQPVLNHIDRVLPLSLTCTADYHCIISQLETLNLSRESSMYDSSPSYGRKSAIFKVLTIHSRMMCYCPIGFSSRLSTAIYDHPVLSQGLSLTLTVVSTAASCLHRLPSFHIGWSPFLLSMSQLSASLAVIPAMLTILSHSLIC